VWPARWARSARREPRMPELPEVETIVRGLRPALRGRTITAVWTSGLGLHLRRAVDARGLRAVAVGGAIADVRRRGKYITLVVEGERRGVGGESGVCIHLGMTGRLRVQPGAAPRAPHTHVVLALEGGDELRFSDPRRFGWVEPGAPLAALPGLSALGPDPLTELEADGLARAMEGVRAPIKAFLLDQHRVAGLGNIYVCEALFGARINPAAPAHRVRGRAAELLRAIRATLEGGIARRGTTLRDYVDADGLAGDNGPALLVYGREGQPCPSCGAPIRRRVDSGRSTFFCARCQKK
jgi:formamidopyrimidine-DNA glycosylase